MILELCGRGKVEVDELAIKDPCAIHEIETLLGEPMSDVSLVTYEHQLYCVTHLIIPSELRNLVDNARTYRARII